MPSVNLVPAACQEHSARRKRGHGWALASIVTLVVVASITLHLWLARHAVGRLQLQLASARLMQTTVDQQLAEEQSLFEKLASRARSVAALRRSHDLHRQLAALSEYAPEGVVFTGISGNRASGPRSPTQPDAPRPSADDSDTALSVEITGYALDHDDLAELTRVIRQIPNWDRVSLRRASREPYLAGEAIAFQLDCGPPGGAP